MVTVTPLVVENCPCVATTVTLPKTQLVVISTDIGYIMCGALDVELLNTRLKDRHIIAARAVGVKTVEELLAAPLESVTDEAKLLGITVGMIGREAIYKMYHHKEGNMIQ
ncbi:MAG: DUF1805 domain-containing protein [Acidibacillus sp.]|uniref:DUF1805 domain-containing protein n=1 Tax=Sulfoacidibacillus ferrooxidans TaxID=2005001 RepID=A0A9X1VA62_9BACL|nr:DUF1805 domain-containing protein [Sulfoacidibacillus ferrooxidans]MCI0182983.1 hypothetical protein [Sulfoacidibacillus ferrooxidans]MCY0893447.1 DUF1805 domain-containing protein [Acidibacillus sp.]